MTRHETGSLAPRFEAAAGLRLPLLAALAGALLLAAAALVAATLLDRTALAPVGIYCALLSAALFTTGRVARLRVRVAREWHRHGDAAPVSHDPVAGPEAPGSPAGRERPAPGRSSAEALQHLAHEGIAVDFAVAGAVALGLGIVFLPDDLASGPPGNTALGIGAVLGLLAFPLLVAARWSALTPAARFPEAPGLAEWFRGGQWVSMLMGVAFLARGLGLEAVDLGRWTAIAVWGVCALCAGEMGLRGLHSFLRSRMAWPDVQVPVQLITLTALFHGRSPLDGLLEVAEGRLGLSLRSTWGLGFLRRSLGPLLAAVLAVLWVSTALVVIGLEEQGIRFRLGRLASRVPLSPGLHLKLPWPLETVDLHPVRRVQALPLGQAGRQKRESLLWTQTHSGEEYQLLLGDGRELVSVDALVTYRIRDVVAHALAFQNPRDALEALGHWLLMRDTVVTNLDRLLSVDREQFARVFAIQLQQACDAHGLGLEILHVGFISLHPPVGIAAAYQAVVSADIERGTLVARARVYRGTTLPGAEAQANRDVQTAESEAVTRMAEAVGGVTRFQAASRWHATAPELFRFRRRLEALEEALADRHVFVVDHRLTRSPGELWIDLRPQARQP